MKLRLLFTLPLLGALTLGTGCVETLDGRYRTGMPVARDKVTAQYERTAQEIWHAAKDVLNYNGKLYTEDVLKSTLEASVNDRTVWVRIEQLDDKRTRVAVQARGRYGGSDIQLAHEIEKQIAIRLASNDPALFNRPVEQRPVERVVPRS